MARVKRGIARKRRNKMLRLAVASVVATEPFRTAASGVKALQCPRSSSSRAFPSPLDCPYQRRSSPEWREYSRLMGGLKKADVRLNRKMLAQLRR